MRCFLKRFSSWSYFLPLVFLSFLLLTILNTTDVFAESWSYTWTSGNSTQNVFGISQSDFCGYKYVVVEGSSSYNLGFYLKYVNPQNSTNSRTIQFLAYNDSLWRSSITFFDLSSLEYGITSCQIQPAQYLSGSQSLTISLYTDFPFSTPSGSISLTENGIFDVSSYAEAVVDVPPIMGDYHNDLVDIKRSIYVGSATLLVIYFFYCIYRMIIKGVKK